MMMIVLRVEVLGLRVIMCCFDLRCELLRLFFNIWHFLLIFSGTGSGGPEHEIAVPSLYFKQISLLFGRSNLCYDTSVEFF